jgi:hypothetical protein
VLLQSNELGLSDTGSHCGPGDRSSFAAALERRPELVNGLTRDPGAFGLPLRVEERPMGSQRCPSVASFKHVGEHKRRCS